MDCYTAILKGCSNMCVIQILDYPINCCFIRVYKSCTIQGLPNTIELVSVFTYVPDYFYNNLTTLYHYQLYCRYSSGVVTPRRHVRTRVYFTSESNIHAMFNILRYGALSDVCVL